MSKSTLAAPAKQVLQQQAFDETQPGSLLQDFRMLLEFIGPDGVPAAGKHNLLPMGCIMELDQRLTRPLGLNLKRPQLRSHPYLLGLHLLLRATGLAQVDGAGGKARSATPSVHRLVPGWCGRAALACPRSGGRP